MQRHWDGAVGEMDKRFRELSSVAMLARRDIDRYIWLSERRPDLAALAPAPPGLQQKVAEIKTLRKNKKCANASSRRAHSRRGLDEMARSSGSELSDLLRFFSTLVPLALCIILFVSLSLDDSIHHIVRNMNKISSD